MQAPPDYSCSVVERLEALAADGTIERDPQQIMIAKRLDGVLSALKARAREMRDDFTRALAIVLADAGNRPAGDPDAHLAAGLIVATWNVAFSEAQNLFDRTRDAGEAKRCFLAVIDRGTAGAAAALARTVYA